MTVNTNDSDTNDTNYDTNDIDEPSPVVIMPHGPYILVKIWIFWSIFKSLGQDLPLLVKIWL